MTSGQDRNSDIQQDLQSAGHTRTRKRRSRRSKLATVLLAAILCFLGSCILELIVYRWKGYSLGLTAIISVVVQLFTAIQGQVLKPDETDEKPEEDDSWAERMVMGVRNFIHRIWQNAMYTSVCTIALWVLISTALAAVHTGGHVLGSIRNSINDIIASSEESANALPNPPPTPSFEDVTETMPVTVTNPVIEPTPAPVSSFYVSLEDPDRDCSISHTLYQNLFYLNGDYVIEDWEDDAKIVGKVEEHVEALIREARNDLFSADTDWEVQRDVDKASQNEKVMQTSGDLDEVITQRRLIFAEHPFGEMAKLIAENYNGYGLAYHKIGGRMNTREYYWCTSIYWYQQVLTFSSSADMISSILQRIGTRYNDLAFIYPDGSEEELRATKLGEAYLSLARSYPAG